MYRIELAPGEEAALRTVDELAAGIRTGVITSRARIWHNAGQKWLPIEFHPHYQAALKQVESESLPATAAAFPVPSTRRESAGSANRVAERAVEPVVEPIAAVEQSADELAAAKIAGTSSRSFRRPMAIVIAGAALIASARMVASATSSDEPPSTVAHMAATVARPALPPATRPAPEVVRSAIPVASAPANSALAPKPMATALESAHAIGGGVVRGPDPSAVALPPTPKPTPTARAEAPEIAPAPVVTELPMPPLPVPTDSAN